MQRSIVKLIAVFALTFVMLIALFLVGSIVSERQNYRNEAVKSISDSYASAQTVVGPVLGESYVRPIIETAVADGTKHLPSIRWESTRLIVFPRTMKLTGEIKPSERHHGLYSATVYEFNGHMEGDIEVPEPAVNDAEFQQPYLMLALSDFRGIVGVPSVTINGQRLPIGQSAQIKLAISEHGRENDPGKLIGSSPMLIVPLPKELAGKQTALHYAIDLTLAGTQSFRVAPVADVNEISLKSSWPSPLFAGAFLPRTRTVTASGFDAQWQISSLASATQQQLPGDNVDTIEISLLQSVDPYKLSDRAVKYGIIFIILTFGSFFVFEMMKQLPIHPVQYLLVGFGLVIFFLLLISFSEHIPFGAAYFIASLACIGLLSFYMSYVLKQVQRGIGFGAMLAVLYGAVYGLLISEDNALLLGALLLFAVLAVVMFVTRHVDWYRAGQPPASTPNPS